MNKEQALNKIFSATLEKEDEDFYDDDEAYTDYINQEVNIMNSRRYE